MPGMTGLEFLPQAKALRPDVPTIMITACGDAATEAQPFYLPTMQCNS
jgi:CheY-like chemotaxis protein